MEIKKNQLKRSSTMTKEVDSVQLYIRYILDEKKQDNIDIIYRGHASTSWELKSSIGRTNYDPKVERQVFYQFKRQYYTYTDERPETDMEILFLAQHYGLPTRLLDWTYNPMIALYFACESEKHLEEDGHIYTYNLKKNDLFDSEGNPDMPKTLNEIFKMEKAKFVVPNYTDVRYKNQKALFLLNNLPEKKFTFPGKAKYLIKKENKKQILQDLARLGYDKTLVYPMLDSLCSDIKKSYSI